MASSNAPASKARELQTGDVVGNYVIVGKLGQGGMGAVYRAKHRELNREAAIKLLTGEHAHSPEMIARFLNEAKIANQVQHAGVVQVYETGRLDGGEAYMVMELLAGETLLDHLRAAAKSGQPAMGTDGLWILRQIAGVMAAAHQSNVVHRDLKPSNIILVPDPEARDGVRVKILDFGIAKFMTRPDTPLPDHLQAVHTKTGVQIGTAPYMSPELWIASKTLDDRVDVYALGVIAYQVLANDWPFPSKANWEFVHRYEDPRPLKSLNATLPDPVCALFERTLAKLPTDRPTMAELRDELSKLLGLKPGASTHSLLALPAAAPADDSPSQLPTADGQTGSGALSQAATADRDRSDLRAGQQITGEDTRAARKRTRNRVVLGAGAATILALGVVIIGRVVSTKAPLPATTPTAIATPPTAALASPSPTATSPTAPGAPPAAAPQPAPAATSAAASDDKSKPGDRKKRATKKKQVLVQD
ncbi:MAG: serine/threonine protein kinase [Myxococcales bacterium]|nr:serine/threonine protein kinase [Myxococcales bacterium]